MINKKKVHEENIYISKKEDINFLTKIKNWVSNLW